MELKTHEQFGAFLASLRKESGLTQQEVAKRLGIAYKTVSKWECGRGYPDITLVPALAEVFSITVDELLASKRNAVSSDMNPSEFQSVQMLQVAQYQDPSIHMTLYIAIGISIVSILLFFIVEEYLLLPFLFVAIVTLCVISMVLVRVSYRKVLHTLKKDDLQNANADDVSKFVSEFSSLCSMAISLAAYSFIQITIYSLWVKSNKSIILLVIISLFCGAIVCFLTNTHIKLVLLQRKIKAKTQ